MKRTHWVTLAAFLSGISGMGIAMHDWREMLSPAFFFGVLGLGAALINSSFGSSPDESNAISRAASSVVRRISGDQ